MSAVEKIQHGTLRLAVKVDGDSRLPWLIVLHSVATSMALWDENMAALTTRYRVLRCDARGHGDSDVAPGPFGFDALVGDVVAVLDHFGITSCDVLGLSMGGMTALGLALDHPDRVRRLVCANARASFPAVAAAAWSTRAAAVAEGGMAAIAEETLTRWFTPLTAAERPALVQSARQMILATPPDGYRGCCGALEKLDYLSRLGTMSVPVLYLAGEADPAAPPAAMEDMAKATPGGQFVILPKAAHLSNLEEPVAFAAAVLRFLDLDEG